MLNNAASTKEDAILVNQQNKNIQVGDLVVEAETRRLNNPRNIGIVISISEKVALQTSSFSMKSFLNQTSKKEIKRRWKTSSKFPGVIYNICVFFPNGHSESDYLIQHCLFDFFVESELIRLGTIFES